MKLFLHALPTLKDAQSIYILDGDVSTNIEIEDSTFVDLEIESEILISSDDLNIIIGNTSLKLDWPTQVNDKFYYKIDINHVIDKLPGFRSHISEKTFETKSGKRQFSKLFLNEIGISKLFIADNNQESFLGSLKVYSSKISNENYYLVTEYLLIKGYFDSHIFYKVTLESQQSELPNSLLEALRRLLDYLMAWEKDLIKFKKYPITLLSSNPIITKYDNNNSIDNESIEWLIENTNQFFPAGAPVSNLKIKKKHYEISEILSTEYGYKFDSYENRVIHGFISNLLRVLIDKEVIFQKTIIPRTRLTNFKDFLIACFNSLLERIFLDAKNKIFHIENFFKKELPVTSPIYDFPKKVDGFHSKMHYQQVLKFINFSKNIFALDFGDKKLSLEIESFDKLFEVYCFYIIKEVISSNFSSKNFNPVEINSSRISNKLSGQYSILLDDVAFKIDLYYECAPKNFIQFSNSEKFKFNPDFILALSNKSTIYYIIFDAKYKNYSAKYLNADLENLTLKYLHKIGLQNDSKNKVIGLFPISLGNLNKGKSIFLNEFDLQGPYPTVPQIGNIEIDPKSFNLKENYFIEIINFGISLLKKV